MRHLGDAEWESLTGRERELLTALGQCLCYLADLNGSAWIAGDSVAAKDMRQRASNVQRIAADCIRSDSTLHAAWYGSGAVSGSN